MLNVQNHRNIKNKVKKKVNYKVKYIYVDQNW